MSALTQQIRDQATNLRAVATQLEQVAAALDAALLEIAVKIGTMRNALAPLATSAPAGAQNAASAPIPAPAVAEKPGTTKIFGFDVPVTGAPLASAPAAQPAGAAPAMNAGLLDTYRSVDALVQDAVRLAWPSVITVDGAAVHPGFGPPDQYAARPDGSVWRVTA